MAWPTLAELKLQLGVTASVKDDLMTRALDAAIEQVKVDCLGSRAIADGENITSPSASQEQAAMLLAVTAVKAPDAPFGVAAVFDTGAFYAARQHPTYQRLLVGQRSSFGIA